MINLKGLALLLALLNFANAQFEGDDCIRNHDKLPGICKIASECTKVFIDQSKHRIPITTCGYSRRQPIVCCPNSEPVAISSNLRISERKCQDYSKLVTTTFYVNSLTANSDGPSRPVSYIKCEFTNPLIVGGTKTKPGEFPHMAALGWTENDQIDFKCGGSLISERYVLTAAHCSKAMRISPDIVRLGDQNLKTLNDGAQAVDYQIAEIIKHPNYKTNTNYDDIALIKLLQSVVFTKFIRPACLWQANSINQTKAVATGFGTTGFGEEKSDELQKVGLDIIDNQECRNFYEERKRLDRGIIESQMCSGLLEGGKDTCAGDSGGPLMVSIPSKACVFYIIGITSFGSTFCGGKNYPGVYTRVSSFLDWIEPIVWKT